MTIANTSALDKHLNSVYRCIDRITLFRLASPHLNCTNQFVHCLCCRCRRCRRQCDVICACVARVLRVTCIACVTCVTYHLLGCVCWWSNHSNTHHYNTATIAYSELLLLLSCYHNTPEISIYLRVYLRIYVCFYEIESIPSTAHTQSTALPRPTQDLSLVS